VLPAEGRLRVVVKKQDLQCRRCEHRWWRRVRQTEELLAWK
jgi:hypothetical protein